MNLQDRTKELIAATLEDMLTRMPLEKVRVGELCALCGAGRQTFYYHFRDKYDVVAWIFERDYRLAELRAGKCNAQAVVADALERMWERRAFYREAFEDKSRYSITAHIQDFDVTLMTAIVTEHLGVDRLTPQQTFAIKHFSHGSIGCTLEWLRGEMEATPQELAAWEFASMPDFLGRAYGMA